MESMVEESSIVKRKRTKRQRPLLSSAAAQAVSSSSTSAELSEITAEEEEDMANCLILLAQGGHKTEEDPEPNATEEATSAKKFTRRPFAEVATTPSGKAEPVVYQCKTCFKCFPSFQALGGHRASHKKPKLSIPSSPADGTKAAAMNGDCIQLSMNSSSMKAAAKERIHECSICGIKFPSGQALGGHMRRHRPANPQEPAKKEASSNKLSLDLNLPPPSDDDEDIT